MTIDATVGGPNSNSYITVEEADDYFSTSYVRPTWSATDVSNKEVVLIESTRLLDTLVKWNGYLKSDSQALKWPRTYVPSTDPLYNSFESDLYSYVSDSIIPKDVKNAVCELAYSLLSNNGFQSSENDLSKVKIGPIAVDFSDTVKTNGLPILVRNMISKLGYYNNTSSNSIQLARLERV